MILYLLLCNILFTPLIFCTETIVSKLNTTNISLPDTPKENLLNGTKIPTIPQTEGGSILLDTLDLALSKDNRTIPSSNSDSGKNKVVARKGVIYSENSSKPQGHSLSIDEKSTNKPITTVEKPSTSTGLLNSTSATTNDINVLKVKESVLNKILDGPKSVNKTETPKKPTILNSEVLENMTVKSSSATVADSTQSLNKEIKSYMKTANNHPGMVMPIVITILLVPMFAVLGYMALKRGQEAWKNRHYKRMDFLLDGMYND